VASTREYQLDPLELRVFPTEGRAQGELYEDDGTSLSYEHGDCCRTTYRYAEGVLTARRSGSYRPLPRRVRIVVADTGATYEIDDDGDWKLEL
jgi:hypothetical protein